MKKYKWVCIYCIGYDKYKHVRFLMEILCYLGFLLDSGWVFYSTADL